jgi:hypothetical protein
LLLQFKKIFKVGGSDTKEISNLNVAEILHILYYTRQGYKLFNTQMGGTDGSISIIENNKVLTKVFTKTMTPQEASQLFFSQPATVEGLTKIKHYFNKIVFTKE